MEGGRGKAGKRDEEGNEPEIGIACSFDIFTEGSIQNFQQLGKIFYHVSHR
jgi:hypothetical protein